MITCRLISEVVADTYHIAQRDLFSSRQGRLVVHARHMAWYQARRLTAHSYRSIGKFMGGAEPATVFAACRAIEQSITDDPSAHAEAINLSHAIRTTAEVLARTGFNGWQDREPIDVAQAFLDAPIRESYPSLEDVRTLATGVIHYSASAAAFERELETRPQAADTEFVQAARKVALATRALSTARFNPGDEKLARKALEAALQTLLKLFEKDQVA